jgi:hypothetical protein
VPAGRGFARRGDAMSEAAAQSRRHLRAARLGLAAATSRRARAAAAAAVTRAEKAFREACRAREAAQ